MRRQTLFGSPGTGKTTTLMQMLEKDLETVPAAQIAFVSFTKQGTNEGAGRAKTKFNLKKSDLRYFRTIHSLCFRQLGLNRSDMIQREHYRTLSEATGINFLGYYTEDLSSSEDIYLHVIQMKLHNAKWGAQLEKDLSAQKMHYINEAYAFMKKQMGILDFTDLLTDYLQWGKPLPVRIAYIDEAQDLTPLQWQVIEKMFSNAEVITVAGDDDQAVFEWSGASVVPFLNFAKDKMVLSHSYRLPERILKLASKVTADIGLRQQKAFSSNGETGALDQASSLKKSLFSGGELLLSRTNWQLREYAKTLRAYGIPYVLKGKPSIDRFKMQAINAWRYGDPEHKMRYKSQYKGGSSTDWRDRIKLSYEEIKYYDNYLHGKLEDFEPVRLETFHSSKGSEADHVILGTKLSKNVHYHMLSNMDPELRCLYVGMTRAKKKLTMLTEESEYAYPYKYFN